MKHAVIFAHPRPRSYTQAVAEAYAAAARALGHTVLVRDLYALDFDPRLQACELPGEADYRVPEDVATERTALADADVFALVYPFWFNAPPAMLKGYVDRVFGLGFGFQPVFGGTDPALTGRRLVSLTSSGAPDRWVEETGALEALKHSFDGHLAQVCGLSVVDHLHMGAITPNLSDVAFDGAMEEVAEAVRRWFA